MLDIKDLEILAKQAVRADHGTSVNFSFNGQNESYSIEQVNDLLSKELSERLGYKDGHVDYYTWEANCREVFALVSRVLGEVIPARVDKMYMQFADVERIAQGDRAVFKIRVTEASKRRARTFVTRGALAGRYETFMLDGAEMTVETGAIVSAIRIGFEEVLDGRWSLADYSQIIMEEFDYFIAREVAAALASMVADIPEVNKATVTGFDEQVMDELLEIADQYGKATIYCAQAFANKMLPADNRWSDNMKDRVWNEGWLGNYKGHNVVILQQGLVDETNREFVVNPSTAYIIPTGTEKPIKIVFEGQLLLRKTDNNEDWSTDIQMYQKVGVGTVAHMGQINWICAYTDSSLNDTRTRRKVIDNG